MRAGSTGISETDLEAIETEDASTGTFIRQERMKAAEKRAAELRALVPTPMARPEPTPEVLPLTDKNFGAFFNAFRKTLNRDEADWLDLVEKPRY